jgi:hypothetical protein
MHIILATTSYKNEQQQDAKDNAELYTKWTNTSCKTYEETIGRGRNRSIQTSLVTDDDEDDDNDVKLIKLFV